MNHIRAFLYALKHSRFIYKSELSRLRARIPF